MNTFTFFALVICAIFAMVSAVPNPAAPDMAADKPEAINDMLEGAESRGYAYYGRRGGGGRGHYGYGYGYGR